MKVDVKDAHGPVYLVRRAGGGCVYLRALGSFESRWTSRQRFAIRLTRAEARHLADWLAKLCPTKVVRLVRRAK